MELAGGAQFAVRAAKLECVDGSGTAAPGKPGSHHLIRPVWGGSNLPGRGSGVNPRVRTVTPGSGGGNGGR